MSPNLARIAFLAIALAACFPAIGRAEEKIASWLDQPKPAAWNTPGALIPAAPKTQGPIDARCRSQARPAELDEDARLRDQGWDLVGAYQGGWQMLVRRQGRASVPGADGRRRDLPVRADRTEEVIGG